MVTDIRTSALRHGLHRLRARIYQWLDSSVLFYITLGLLLFQSLWIALSARYPQAFDEAFHFGIIQLHAQQLLPFFTSQPPGAEIHGALVRDPSYLYHYLMSFPYRLLSHVTTSLTAQIIGLRLINIGLFAAGLVVYRQLLQRLGFSRRLTHTALLFFVLIPVVPLLASQINYDNLVFPLTGLLLLSAHTYLQKLQDNQLDIQMVLLIILNGLLTAIVKYTSLPLTIALLGILLFVTWRYIYRRKEPVAIIFPRKSIIVLGIVGLIILGSLNIERYGINMVRYHSPSPDCAKVLTIAECQSYGPWVRDYQFAQTYPRPSLWQIFIYPFVWLHRMVFETMFVISSRFNAQGVIEYIPAPPLTVANYTAWTLVIAGLGTTVVYIRRLWNSEILRYFLIVSIFYTAVLFAKNFSMFMHTGEAVAIHGRYLVPIYPLLFASVMLTIGYFWQQRGWPQAKTWMVIVTLVLLTQGAGLVAWIFRSDPSWYWSREPNALVYQINRPVQTLIHHIVIP